MSSSSSLPPLYFANKASPPDSILNCLPAELLSQCVVEYANFGVLAKLSCVQRSWSSLLDDVANVDSHQKWQLSQAFLEGTHGLERNPQRALTLLLELAKLPTTPEGKPVISTENRTECPQQARAMTQIADLHLNNNNNIEVGLAWLEASYVVGQQLESAHQLALIYEYGHYGITVDVRKAFDWFSKAAQAGHVESMTELALCYELGCGGIEQSDELALEWYRRAAEQGHVTAKYSMGEAFEEARGVPQSDEEACLWYYRAAIMGDEDSKRALRRLRDIARIVVPGVMNLLGE